MAKDFWASLITKTAKNPARKPARKPASKKRAFSASGLRRVSNPSWDMRVFETKDGKTFAFSKDPTCCGTTSKLKKTGLVPSKSTGRFWYEPTKK